MGSTCSKGAQDLDSFRRTFEDSPQVKKCIISDQHSEIILEFMEGSIATVPYQKKHQPLEISHCGQQGLCFTVDARVFYFLEFSNQNEKQFIQTVHAYHLYQKSKSTQIIEIKTPYLCKQQNSDRYTFLLESAVLGDQNHKFVDIVDLGLRMRRKGICWQDREFEAITVQISRKVGQLHKERLCGVQNVIIGNDGSIHLLGILMNSSESALEQDTERIRKILLCSLFGRQVSNMDEAYQLEDKSQFKRTQSLSSIKDLKQKMKEEKVNKYERITNPNLKFIKDYIEAYFYQLDPYSPYALKAYMGIEDYNSAKKMLIGYIIDQKYYEKFTPESYHTYMMLVQVEEKISENSLDHIQAKEKLAEISYQLGMKELGDNNYLSAYDYFNVAKKYSFPNTKAQVYVQISATSFALGMSEICETTLAQGIKLHFDHKILHLLYISYLCDCLRVEEAQKHLLKATKHFSTLYHEICQAKIFLAKSLTDPTLRQKYLNQANQNIEKVVLSQYENQGCAEAISYYYEVLGDIRLQAKKYSDAHESYHTALIYQKKEEYSSKYRQSTLKAAEGNCSLMLEQFDKSLSEYGEGLSLINPSCQKLWHSIRGNIGICKIRKGQKKTGIMEIESVLSEVSADSILYDYNYIFLQNILSKVKADGSKLY